MSKTASSLLVTAALTFAVAANVGAQRADGAGHRPRQGAHRAGQGAAEYPDRRHAGARRDPGSQGRLDGRRSGGPRARAQPRRWRRSASRRRRSTTRWPRSRAFYRPNLTSHGQQQLATAARATHDRRRRQDEPGHERLERGPDAEHDAVLRRQLQRQLDEQPQVASTQNDGARSTDGLHDELPGAPTRSRCSRTARSTTRARRS